LLKILIEIARKSVKALKVQRSNRICSPQENELIIQHQEPISDSPATRSMKNLSKIRCLISVLPNANATPIFSA
jgi:hypothetical protein